MALAAASTMAYTVTVFGPGSYDPDPAQLDQNVGVTGYLIEGFESGSLGARAFPLAVPISRSGSIRRSHAIYLLGSGKRRNA